MFSRSLLLNVGIISMLLASAFAIIGNIVPIYFYTLPSATVFISPWRISSCSGYYCTVSDADQLIYTYSSALSCDIQSFQNHVVAGGAYGVITAAIAGSGFAALFIMNLWQRPNRHSAIVGLVFSAIISVNSIVSLILVFSIRADSCISSQNLGVHASGFMYVGAMLFSWVGVTVYAVWVVRNKPQRAPKVRPQNAYTYDAARRPVAPQPPSVTQTRSTPQIVRSPQPEVWPEGNDWVTDEASGLLWSEERHLFFDRSSGQFFDPRTDQWFDPEQNRWYKLTV